MASIAGAGPVRRRGSEPTDGALAEIDDAAQLGFELDVGFRLAVQEAAHQQRLAVRPVQPRVRGRRRLDAERADQRQVPQLPLAARIAQMLQRRAREPSQVALVCRQLLAQPGLIGRQAMPVRMQLDVHAALLQLEQGIVPAAPVRPGRFRFQVFVGLLVPAAALPDIGDDQDEADDEGDRAGSEVHGGLREMAGTRDHAAVRSRCQGRLTLDRLQGFQCPA